MNPMEIDNSNLRPNYDRDAFFKKFKEHISKIDNLPTPGNLAHPKQGQIHFGAKLQNLARERTQQRTEESQPLPTESYFDEAHQTGGSSKKRRYLNLFQVDRGPCLICMETDKICEQYRACFNINQQSSLDMFQCLNCGCPMNSHAKVRAELSFSNVVCQQINRRYLNEQHFNFKALIAIFMVDRLECQDFRVDVEGLATSLNEGGFNVLSFQEMDIATLQRIWIEKSLYNLKSQLSKEDFKKYHNYLEKFLEIVHLYGVENDYTLRDSIKVPEDMKLLEYYLGVLKKVNAKFQQAYSDDQIAIVFLISGNRQNLELDFKKFIMAANKQLPTDLQYFYSSQSRQRAIRDTMLFFPTFYKLKITSFIIMQQYDDVHQDRRKINDTFVDMLDFNNISVLKHDFGVYGFRNQVEALSFIPNTEKFLSFAQIEGSPIQMKICCKIGPSNLTILAQHLPNYYRISTQTQNQSLCDRLCPELFINHRMMLVYRPIVVKSGMEMLLMAPWRLNDFVLIDSIYRRLTHAEAQMFGALENIHSANLPNYITMMTEGFCFIAVLSRGGAFQVAKIIAEGCRTGLKVRQSRKLQDLKLEHQTKTGQHYEEKIPLQFYNMYDSFTQANIFGSIKDMFNLEELVLQENQAKFNRNIFQSDEQVYLAPNQLSSQTNITPQMRQQIIRDLMKENYNFYSFTTQDEQTTEQLISLFMPECSQIENVLVILKPVLFEEVRPSYLHNIKLILERMKFTIFEDMPLQMDPVQARELINYISDYKLPEDLMEQVVDEYSRKPIHIFSLMKPAGKKEMLQFLIKANFVIPPFKTPELTHEVQPLLLPCSNVQTTRFLQSFFSKALPKFTADVLLIPERVQERTHILRFILGVTFGVQLQSLDSELLNEEKSLRHQHCRVSSVSHGDFEIRIRESREKSKYLIIYNDILYDYELLSWYYSKVNQSFPQRCPLSYQYRINYPDRISSGEVDQIFDCQEFVGRNFLLEIYRQVFQFGSEVFENLKVKKIELFEKQQSSTMQVPLKEQKFVEDQMRQVAGQMEKRVKMLSYFWGVKLSKFVKELELVKCDEFPNGYGPIVRKQNGYECKYKINTNEYTHVAEVQRKHYANVMLLVAEYIQDRSDNDPQFYNEINSQNGSQMQQSNLLMQSNLMQSNNMMQSNMMFSQMEGRRDNRSHIEKRLYKHYESIFPNGACSELFKMTLSEGNLRLLPANLQLHQLRILRDKEQMKVRQVGHDGSQLFDWNYEAKETKRMRGEEHKTRQPYTNYVLSHCLPNIRSKFELVGTVFYLLWVELKLMKHYDKFIDISILEADEGFHQTITKKYSHTTKNHHLSKSINQLNKANYFQWFKEHYDLDKSRTIDEFIKGFEDSYFLEEEVIAQVQQKFKEQQIIKKKKIPEVIHMFVFLKCLDELERYINEHKQIREDMAHIGKQSLIQQRMPTDKLLEDQEPEQNKYVHIEELKKDKVRVEGLIKIIFNFLMSDKFHQKFYFDQEETELQFNRTKQKEEKFNIEYFMNYMQSNLVQFEQEERNDQIHEQLQAYFEGKKAREQQKEFIPSKRYFQPLEQGNNKKEWGKLDQEAIDEQVELIDENRKRDVVREMDNYIEAPYLKEIHKDDIQRKWIEGIKDTGQGRFVDTRPDNVKTGIYVDSVKTIEKKMDERIDEAIKKFMKDKMNDFNKKSGSGK